MLYLCEKSLLFKFLILSSFSNPKSGLINRHWIPSLLIQHQIIRQNIRIHFPQPIIYRSNVKKIVLDFTGTDNYFGFQNVLIGPCVRVNDLLELLCNGTDCLCVNEFNRLVGEDVLLGWVEFLLHCNVDIIRCKSIRIML